MSGHPARRQRRRRADDALQCGPDLGQGIQNAVELAIGGIVQIATALYASLRRRWGANDTARLGHEPKTSNDLINCGDVGNKSVCNPSPTLVEGLP